jgi:hypothetical protein
MVMARQCSTTRSRAASCELSASLLAHLICMLSPALSCGFRFFWPYPPIVLACSPQEDYRFGLLWEWNLYEAMLFSPYVAARLQTYTGTPAEPMFALYDALGLACCTVV